MDKEFQKYLPRVPISIHGGIRAQMKRSNKQRKPWAQRWLDYMESLSMGARIGRGRSYSISGQVYDLVIKPGLIEAKVQGASKEPYLCRLSCEVLESRVRSDIIKKIKNRPLLLSQLSVQSLPYTVERFFKEAGYPLIPTLESCLLPSCTCPDSVCNCKHIAALMFIVSEAIENDPIILLTLRGITREDLFGKEKERKKKEEKASTKKRFTVKDFWSKGSKVKDYGAEIEVQGDESPLIRRLGTIPMWCGEEHFTDVMHECVTRATLGIRD